MGQCPVPDRKQKLEFSMVRDPLILVQQKTFLGYSASKPNSWVGTGYLQIILIFLRRSKGNNMCDFNFLLAGNEMSDSDAGNFAEHISKSRLYLVIEYTC